MNYPDASTLPTLANRLEYAMRHRGLKQERLAELAGCSQASIQKVATGRTKKSKFLPNIARALNVDVNWLELGTPPASVQEMPSGYHANRSRDGVPVALGLLSPWDDETPLEDDEVELPIYKEVELQSGQGRSQVQMVEGRKVRFSRYTLRTTSVDPSTAACARNVGNSNFPLILDGATLGIDRGMTRIHDGQIYAIDHDGLLRIKFVYRLPGGGIRLRSYNRAEYEDEDYTFDQIMEQRIVILGRVFWWSTLNPLNAAPLV